jgi:hypothetical protein
MNVSADQYLNNAVYYAEGAAAHGLNTEAGNVCLQLAVVHSQLSQALSLAVIACALARCVDGIAPETVRELLRIHVNSTDEEAGK